MSISVGLALAVSILAFVLWAQWPQFRQYCQHVREGRRRDDLLTWIFTTLRGPYKPRPR